MNDNYDEARTHADEVIRVIRDSAIGEINSKKNDTALQSSDVKF